MPAESKLLLIAYPLRPNTMFEGVMMQVEPTTGWRIDRFRTVQDIISIASSEAQGGTVAITQLDLFAHGRPGAFGMDDQLIFDCFQSRCALRGVEEHLAPNAVIRFLGCDIAAERTQNGWAYDPREALAWLSSQLGGRSVEAPTCDIGVGSFNAQGFAQSLPGMMLAAQRNPTP